MQFGSVAYVAPNFRKHYTVSARNVIIGIELGSLSTGTRRKNKRWVLTSVATL
jgi:hypothetical protein